MSLERASQNLGWPSANLIYNPPGKGAAVVLERARAKIESQICRKFNKKDIKIGILTTEPGSSDTQAPVALVCEFVRPVRLDILHELHRLAWNFSHTSLLITVEPHRVRAFTCCEYPQRTQPSTEDERLEAEIPEAEYSFEDSSIQAHAASLLHWLNLATGQLQRQIPERFDRKKAADNSLLENLEFVRKKLHDIGDLEYDLIHDLLARLIFVQFLFQRCDSEGIPALNKEHLAELHDSNVLSKQYESLSEILSSHTDTYQLFKHLNDKFNGDLFPDNYNWQTEQKQVTQAHLNILKDFIEGEIKIKTGQYALWPLYSFDTIPLEFISSIYEAFVSKHAGTVYTPTHLVDFILDGVLPWDGSEWDIKILEPACGSGIFLVRAFQRLMYRWKQQNPSASTHDRIAVLKHVLTHNLLGIDINRQAVRVASFSLYLAMCDEIDPRYYWNEVEFPNLRDNRLIEADFFSEDYAGFRTKEDADTYDLIVGNPPWGKKSLPKLQSEFNSESAQQWAKSYAWPTPYKDIGPLFISKSLELSKSGGYISLLQPASTLLFNKTAQSLREKLFTQYMVQEIVNLSILRFGLFKEAVGPAVIFTIQPITPKSIYNFTYIVAKPNIGEQYTFVIENYDIHEIKSVDALKTNILTSFIWGGYRDLALLKRLDCYPTPLVYLNKGILIKRQGIIRGDRKKSQKTMYNRKIFDKKNFPDDVLVLNEADLSVNTDCQTDSKASTDFSAFSSPQILIKQGWRKSTSRFRAVIVNSKDGILCSDSYITMHSNSTDTSILESICLGINSLLAVYYLLLTNDSFANYRPKVRVDSILSVPSPYPNLNLINDIQDLPTLDDKIQALYGLKEPEQALIDDMLSNISFFKDGASSPACQKTSRDNSSSDSLNQYCDWFIRVLKATFGNDKKISATIFQEKSSPYLSIRLVAIHLESPSQSALEIECIDNKALATELSKLQKLVENKTQDNAIIFRRVIRVFDTVEKDGKKIPTIFIAKPDEVRYWTRSMAMRDADEIALDIMQWQKTGQEERTYEQTL